MGTVLQRAMFLVVNANGKYWDGMSWTEQGRPFLTVAAATRSLYEEGEDFEEVKIVEKHQ
jgi:hypothetical protein